MTYERHARNMRLTYKGYTSDMQTTQEILNDTKDLELLDRNLQNYLW